MQTVVARPEVRRGGLPEPRYPRLGRLSLGYTTRTAAGKMIPARSDTFVFSSDDRVRIEAVASVLGGVPEQVPGRENRWRVITGARELEVVLPDLSTQTAPPVVYELWGSSGCLRRCDGETALFAIDPDTGERRDHVPCICRSNPDRFCRIACRVNVIVSSLASRVPGIGVWQYLTSSAAAASEIAGVVGLLRGLERAAGRPLVAIPAVLRVVERRGRDAGGTPRTWHAVRLELNTPPTALAGLPAPAEPPVPPVPASVTW